MPQWNFLTNHALVLSFVAQHPSITARELAQAVGITERAIRRIVLDLETDGYVSKRKVGRGLRYRVNPDLSLRHEAHWDKAVGDLLEVLGWKKRARRTPRKASSEPVGTHNDVKPQQ